MDSKAAPIEAKFGKIGLAALDSPAFGDAHAIEAPTHTQGDSSMIRKTVQNPLRLAVLAAIALTMVSLLPRTAICADEETSLRVVVTEASDGKPVFQAQLTLKFKIPQKFRQPKWISYSAKTNKDGEYVFRRVNKGPYHLLVTAEGHQSFGKQSEIDSDNPTVEVKLRRPQPQI